MYPGTQITRSYKDGMPVEPQEAEEAVSPPEETVRFWKSSQGRLRLAGTARRRGETEVSLTMKEAISLGYSPED